ncbi:methionyl-tRNA synthetase [Rhizodiscina lignyota]|uniref:methionine--tRNA ligase n=1 Tax=Rhizodiscina lignyota TaxID=1504668 RepID=A0A9P4M7H6_9PEZI|nr:methionyl-tRNA synthetase [Rhizodiscina lignyota]
MGSLEEKILPVEGKRNILITSALPYVNNVPHLGNIIGSVLSADVFARYCKARGLQTLFVCGTDEYGTATETKAIEEGLTPQQLCDKYHKLHTDVYEWFNIGFDKWGRTPTQQQTDIAQDIFTKLYQNGYLEEKTTTQPYCDAEDARGGKHGFLADRFVEGTCPRCGYEDARGDQCDKCGSLLDPLELIGPRCKIHPTTTPVPRETKHVFILLDKLQPLIEEWSRKASKEGEWSSNGKSITEKWLNEGLKPRGITRDLKWGTAVPLPGYEEKVLYVWFDACIGYVSITATYTEEWEKWWRNPEHVQLYQFMGKDNVPFHTVIFPGSQMGTKDKWTMLHHLSTTEYLNYENGKFSKSRGIGVFGNNARDTGIPSDVWRYYLLSHRPEAGDSEFEWSGFITANNNTLVNNLGNFINRVIKFADKTYSGVVPDYTKYSDESLQNHIQATNEALAKYLEFSEQVKLKAALMEALNISYLGNKFLQDHSLSNKFATEQPDRCAAVVGLALNHAALLAGLIGPYLPTTSGSIATMLSLDNKVHVPIPDTFVTDLLKPGHKLGEPKLLFTVIKPDMEATWREMFGGDEARKAREEAAAAAKAKSDAKKAEKERKKAKKAAQPKQDEGKSVEAAEKDGAEKADSKTAIEEVTDGVKQATLQTS